MRISRKVVEGIKASLRTILPSALRAAIRQALRPFFPQTLPLLPLPNATAEAAIAAWDQNEALHQAAETMAWKPAETPKASIIILSHDRLGMTQSCLEHLLCSRQDLAFEVIVVDNASTDGTPEFIRHLSKQVPHLRLITNRANAGFARANNQGICASSSDYVVLLNNDTIVTEGWLANLVQHLETHPNIGMIGPVTNSAGNEQRIRVSYQTVEEMQAVARRRATAMAGQLLNLNMLAMFCTVLPRRVLDRVGLLDERFGVGTFSKMMITHIGSAWRDTE